MLIQVKSNRKSMKSLDFCVFVCSGESSHFFVSKSSNNSTTETGTFSVGISGPSTVFLDANPTEHGYEVIPLSLSFCLRSSLGDLLVSLQTNTKWKISDQY